MGSLNSYVCIAHLSSNVIFILEVTEAFVCLFICFKFKDKSKKDYGILAEFSRGPQENHNISAAQLRELAKFNNTSFHMALGCNVSCNLQNVHPIKTSVDSSLFCLPTCLFHFY